MCSQYTCINYLHSQLGAFGVHPTAAPNIISIHICAFNYIRVQYGSSLSRTGHFPCNFPPQCTPTWLASLNMSTMDFRVITSSNICSQQTYHHYRPSSHMHRMVLALKLTAASPHTHTHMQERTRTHTRHARWLMGFIIQARGNKKSLSAAGLRRTPASTHILHYIANGQAYLHFLISLAKLP